MKTLVCSARKLQRGSIPVLYSVLLASTTMTGIALTTMAAADGLRAQQNLDLSIVEARSLAKVATFQRQRVIATTLTPTGGGGAVYTHTYFDEPNWVGVSGAGGLRAISGRPNLPDVSRFGTAYQWTTSNGGAMAGRARFVVPNKLFNMTGYTMPGVLVTPSGGDWLITVMSLEKPPEGRLHVGSITNLKRTMYLENIR